MRRRRPRGAAWFGALLVVGLTVGVVTVQALFDRVFAAGFGFAVTGSQAAWTLPKVLPGRTVKLAGAQQLTVVSDEPWELVVASRMIAGGGGKPVSSSVFVGVSRQGAGASGEGGSEPEWVRVSGDETRFVHRGGPTGPDGEAIRVDLQIRPSWDDPPGAAIVTEVTTTLSVGESALLAYASPSEVPAGDEGPISFWFRAPGGESERVLRPGELIRLDIWKEDVDLVARLTIPVGEGPWYVITWDSLPKGGLEPGMYRFRIVTAAEERLLASGMFHVGGAQAAWGMVEPLAQGSSPNAPAGAGGFLPARPEFPEIKAVVTGDPARLGEPAAWTLTLINPESTTLMGLQAEICLSPGWSLIDADVPRVSIESSDLNAVWGRSCQVLLLGTLQGNRQKRVRITLLAWEGGQAASRQARKDLVVRVTGTLEPGGERGLLLERRLPLALAEDPLLLPSLEIWGRVFIDLNGSGEYEEGEPVVPGAGVLVDGERTTVTNRRGEYRIEIGYVPELIWADSDRGTGLPRSIHADELWIDRGRLDLPILPASQSVLHEHGSGGPGARSEGANSIEGGHLAFFARLGAEADRQNAEATLRAGLSYPDATFSFDFRGGVGWDPVEGVEQALLDDLKVEAAAQAEGLGLELQWEMGLEREIKLGLLRPSKPVESAYRLKVDLRPQIEEDIATQVSSGQIAGPYRLSEGRVELGAEWGYAAGDIWSCFLQEASAAYVAPGSRIALSSTQGRHTRVERGGPREGEVHNLRLEVDGGAMFSGRRWPYSFELSGGRPRRLSPSCGLSPFDGWRWHGVVAPPAGSAVQAVWWSGMIWPMTPEETSKTRPGHAHELGLTWRPITVGGERVDVSTAIQWDRFDGSSPGPARLAARLGSRLAGMHDVRLEMGALVLASTDNPDHLARGDRRLALSWRVTRGQVRPWAKYEIMAPYGEVSRSHELGVSLSHSFSRQANGQQEPERLNTSVRVSRAVDAKDVTDKLRVDLRSGDAFTRLEWSGTAPVGGGSSWLRRESAYEKADWRVLFEGEVAGGRGEWGLAVEGARSRDDAELEAKIIVGGGWNAGRWQAGWGRGTTYEKGEWIDFTTAVVRVAAVRGPWAAEARAERKVGLHDTGLQHGAYHMSVRRKIGGAWAVAANSSLTVARRDGQTWRYGIGLERGLRAGERSPALRIGLVWEVESKRSHWASPRATPGALTGASAGKRGPRLEASLALPYLW